MLRGSFKVWDNLASRYAIWLWSKSMTRKLVTLMIADIHLHGCWSLPLRLHILLFLGRSQAKRETIREAKEHASSVLALPACQSATQYRGGNWSDQADRCVDMPRTPTSRGVQRRCIGTRLRLQKKEAHYLPAHRDFLLVVLLSLRSSFERQFSEKGGRSALAVTFYNADCYLGRFIQLIT
jgi:hypothetical protein